MITTTYSNPVVNPNSGIKTVPELITTYSKRTRQNFLRFSATAGAGQRRVLRERRNLDALAVPLQEHEPPAMTEF